MHVLCDTAVLSPEFFHFRMILCRWRQCQSRHRRKGLEQTLLACRYFSLVSPCVRFFDLIGPDDLSGVLSLPSLLLTFTSVIAFCFCSLSFWDLLGVFHWCMAMSKGWVCPSMGYIYIYICIYAHFCGKSLKNPLDFGVS